MGAGSLPALLPAAYRDPHNLCDYLRDEKNYEIIDGGTVVVSFVVKGKLLNVEFNLTIQKIRMSSIVEQIKNLKRWLKKVEGEGT